MCEPNDDQDDWRQAEQIGATPWRRGRSRSASPHQNRLRKRRPPCILAINSTTGFLADFSGGWTMHMAGRKPPVFRTSRTAAAPPHSRSPSHAFCVRTIDLASVSTIVRSVSNNVRRTHPIVSTNLRQKLPLIARRTGYDCAPLHVGDPVPPFLDPAPSRPGHARIGAGSWKPG